MGGALSGFTLSHRDKWGNPIFKNLLEAAIYSWMEDTAAWKDTYINFGDTLVHLKRGQLVTTVSFISQGFCVGDRATRTLLEKLEITGYIDKQTTNKYTIITICNYEEKQLTPKTDNQSSDKRTTNGRQTADNNKNKDNEINKEEYAGASAPVPNKDFKIPDEKPRSGISPAVTFITLQKKKEKGGVLSDQEAAFCERLLKVEVGKVPKAPNYDGISCGCGKHFGKGSVSAEQRAKNYAFSNRGGVYNPEQARWLQDYEKSHGKVEVPPPKNMPQSEVSL